MTMVLFRVSLLLLVLFVSNDDFVTAWTTPRPSCLVRGCRTIPPPFTRSSSTSILLSQSTDAVSSSPTSSTTTTTTLPKDSDNENDEKNDDEEEEWEYVEYEELQETDFTNSEWLVGTNWDSQPNRIDETWCRCVVDERGKNVCVWGDGSTGQWSMDRASQYFSISKEFLWGKQIWAGVVEDYYFLQGTVRGWTYITPASVLGQWQARRLGVDAEEAGVAPWFQEEEDDDSSEEKEEESVKPDNLDESTTSES